MSQNIALKIKTNYFEIDGDSESFDLGSKIVCETPNGLQLGDAVAVCPKKVTGGSAKFIRVASDEDIKKAEKIAERKNEVIKVTNSLIKKYDLKMKIVEIHSIFANKTDNNLCFIKRKVDINYFHL